MVSFCTQFLSEKTNCCHVFSSAGTREAREGKLSRDLKFLKVDRRNHEEVSGLQLPSQTTRWHQPETQPDATGVT